MISHRTADILNRFRKQRPTLDVEVNIRFPSSVVAGGYERIGGLYFANVSAHIDAVASKISEATWNKLEEVIPTRIVSMPGETFADFSLRSRFDTERSIHMINVPLTMNTTGNQREHWKIEFKMYNL